jgi:glucokinase
MCTGYKRAEFPVLFPATAATVVLFMASVFLGIEIGGTKLQLVAGTASAIQERCRFDVDVKRGAAGIREQIERNVPELIKRSKAEAISVGFGGPVDRRAGRIARSHQIEGWSDFDLESWLSELSGLPVVLDNDANMGALGEAILGAGKNADPVFYVTLGSGVGGGLVVDGEVYHGASPGESEIGHLRLDRDGTIVEERCSGWAVDRRIREKATGALRELIGHQQGCEARHLARALELQDPSAKEILRETAENLAIALSHVVHLFHPAVIVLGGGLSLVGEPLRAAVAELLPRFTMKVLLGTTEVRLARLGEDAVPVGCLLAAQRKMAVNATDRRE